MVRPACLSIIQFPLQILLNAHPEWSSQAVVVVSEDTPLGVILETNRAAREAGAQRGMRYSVALTVCPALQAGVVGGDVLQQQIDGCITVLYHYTPHVEECSFDPGTFWLDASGLGALYHSPAQWVAAVRRAMQKIGFFCRICVGFSRFGSYAGAKSATRLFRSSAQERRWAQSAPLTLLPLPPRVEQRLAQLGIATVGDFCALPRDGIRNRFGIEADTVYRFAVEDDTVPLQGDVPAAELAGSTRPVTPVRDRAQLLAEIEALLLDLLSQTIVAGLYLQQLTIELSFEDHAPQYEVLRPATAERDAAVWLRLLRLRMEDLNVPSGVSQIALQGRTVNSAAAAQTDLFSSKVKRDPAAAARVFAHLRARFGNGVVCRVALQQQHRPDRQFVLLPLDRPALPAAAAVSSAFDGKRHCRLVRRIYDSAIELKSRSRLRPAAGPFVVAGRWWEQESERHYYYAYCGRRIVWLYYDSGTRRWMQQGTVE
ncbi:MAG: hypothetical protein EA384_08785 [Spirochaetaceae bacterium]|nr:MAG: hypothetical protein EA384_08785 [Spirochaetaceae bacterium]